MKWFYIYSPKYEIFHKIIMSYFIHDVGFELIPIFVPQEAFSNTYKYKEHFFAGNTLKIKFIIEALKDNQGEHIIFSDVDLIVKHHAKLYEYLQPYKRFDMVFMKDNMIDNTRNIGFSLLKSLPETICFFQDVLDSIIKTNQQDQRIVNELLPTFSGTNSIFTMAEMIQSNCHNMLNDFYVLQLLCSHSTPEENIAEKLCTVARIVDIKPYIHLVSPLTREIIKNYFVNNPANMFWINVLCS